MCLYLFARIAPKTDVPIIPPMSTRVRGWIAGELFTTIAVMKTIRDRKIPTKRALSKIFSSHILAEINAPVNDETKKAMKRMILPSLLVIRL